MNTTPPTECRAWSQLAQHAQSWRPVHLREVFAGDAARAQQLAAQAPGLRLDYSRQRLGATTLRLLAHLADERGLPEWRAALLAGKTVNSTENRAAWHTALRAGDNAEVKNVLQRMRALASRLREEKKFKRIVNLGIGS
jgi:glucose-6-phosphate isomerase